MKILKIFRDDEEPNPCSSCEDEWNGLNYVRLSLGKEFSIWVNLCDDCLEKFRKLHTTEYRVGVQDRRRSLKK